MLTFLQSQQQTQVNETSVPQEQNTKSKLKVDGDKNFGVYIHRSEQEQIKKPDPMYPEPTGNIFASFPSDVVKFSANSIEGKEPSTVCCPSSEGEEPSTVCCPSSFQEFGQMFLECLLGLER